MDGTNVSGNTAPKIWLRLYKIAGRDFEQPEAGPKGGKGRTPKVMYISILYALS
jgi:hypothetical protein